MLPCREPTTTTEYVLPSPSSLDSQIQCSAKIYWFFMWLDVMSTRRRVILESFCVQGMAHRLAHQKPSTRGQESRFRSQHVFPEARNFAFYVLAAVFVVSPVKGVSPVVT